jgi:molybdopterin molybdotransferase
MTGAVLPRGCDCIVPVERLAVSGRTATIDDDYAAEQRRFIHPQGSDHKAGDVLLQVGREISPLDVAVIASCGMANVVVGRKPKVRVISTGNELVAPGQAIEPHQIRLSNGPALVAMLSQAGFDDCAHEQLSDDRHALKASFERHLAEADVMVLSGGVSMGKADFVPEVLAGLGVEQIFHRITQRPGKPMWFGVGPEEQAVFALPGNPVSSMVCCRHYVLPALLRASGRAEPAVQMAALAEAVNFAPALTLFLPVRTTVSAEGRILAVPVPTNTSGDFASLSGTDGYVELVCEEASFAAGRSVPLYRWSRP